MGKVEEVQEQMKADMVAMKEQMATIMEAMMSMKKIMEANAVAVAATSAVAKVNPMPPSGLNQMNHPTSNMVGKDLGSTGGPHYAQIQNKHAFPLYGLPPNYTPPNVAYIPNEDVNNSAPMLIESRQPHHMVGYTPSSFADLVFTDERIKVGMKRGKFNHLAWTNEKTGANEEGENEGETHAVTAIPIQPSFPPTQQCHYSANNKPSPYPPPSYPQRPSLNQPQSLSTTLPMTNTTFSTNQNINHEMNFAAKKPVEFTPILVSYADLLPYLLDNSMVAITPTKVPQPPFFRGYDSNATCAYQGGALGHSIEHFPGPHPDPGGGPTMQVQPKEEAIVQLLCIPGQDFTHATAKRRVWIMHTNMITLTQIWMTLLLSTISSSDRNTDLPLRKYQDSAHKAPSGPEGVQQGPGVFSSSYGPLSVLQGARPPNKGSRPLDTQWTQRSPNRVLGLSALITGLCQFYGVHVIPSKVIRPPTNRAFIKKCCAPRRPSPKPKVSESTRSVIDRSSGVQLKTLKKRY
ncbi:hypothetical protein HKD37_20G056057 [Glycine soja]